jgi:hypothetical protein
VSAVDLLGDSATKRAGLGTHESTRMEKDEWLTPPHVLLALGDFDLDPASPITRPWDTAKRHFNIMDDGLKQPWEGRVWLNPPYGAEAGKWLARLAAHPGGGIAMIFARTETQVWFEHIWPVAHAVLFLKGRVAFLDSRGRLGTSAAGAPSALVAYGKPDAVILRGSGLAGAFVPLREIMGGRAQVIGG